jgi:hypothetical protein
MRLPSISAVAAQLRKLNQIPSRRRLEVRLRVFPNGSWFIYEGDPWSDPEIGQGYSGWGTVPGSGRRFDSAEVAKDMLDQVKYHYRNPAPSEDEIAGLSSADIGLIAIGLSAVGLIGYLLYKSSPPIPATTLGQGGSTTPLGPAANTTSTVPTYQPGSVDTTDDNSIPPFVSGF